MKNILKKIWQSAGLIFGLALLLASPVLAADLNYSSDTVVALTSPSALNLTIKQGSAATSVTINAGSLAATIPASATFTVTANNQPLTVTGMASSQTTVVNTCAVSGLNTIAVTAAAVETLTFTPASQCSSSSGQPAIGVGGGGISTQTPTPTVSFYADYSTITAGQSATLTWTTSNTTSVSINQGIGAVALSGSKSVTPTSTTAYILTAVGSGGTVTQTVTVAIGLAAVTASPTSTPPAQASSPFPSPASGTSILSQVRLINDNNTFYLVVNGQRQGVTSPGILNSYGLEFKDAVSATPADLALSQGSLLLPANGSLAKSLQDPTVYLISNGQRYGFISASVFKTLGYSFSSVLIVTNPELQALPSAGNLASPQAAHLPGTDINLKGTIYWVGTDNQLHGYPSLTVYNSWHRHNNFSTVVKANSADQALPVGVMVQARVLQ